MCTTGVPQWEEREKGAERTHLKKLAEIFQIWWQILILKKKNTFEQFISQFQNLIQSYLIKTVWDLHMVRHIDQWTLTENPNINSHIYGQFSYNKVAKTV
jgi:hypothetical protein